ncbi:cell wall metabolism sensor histidine kinase WalK [Turicibacter sp. TS3]|uniref:sensor histidine kinase n=1 Tax=Turicibacter sp. TS3 TaxID=2304578 RepID=UPI00137AFA76|nr:ATP-binding protein [Turicibacter sp. TS3]NCE78919.1 two-component sensor histidine kinase [Turicibacter sp. TS3]
MIKTRHELLSFYLLCTILLFVNIGTSNDGQITFVFLMMLLIVMISQYRRSMIYLKQLKRYDEVALLVQEKNDYSSIRPLVIEQQEVVGVQYNQLMRFIHQQEFRNKRNMQILNIITNNIQDPIVILNIHGELEYANNQFKEWVHMTALKKLSFYDVKNEPIRKILEDALICEKTRKKQLKIHNKYYSSVAHPIFDEQGDFNGVVVLFHDISDLKKYENLQKEFFSNVSHELKTPISAIKGCSEILLNGGLKDQAICEEFLTIIQNENLRIERLVKDLLLINRYEHDQIKHQTQRLEVNHLLNDCIQNVQTIANFKHQTIDFVEEKKYWVEGDYTKLQHCFLNLLTNAIHYSPDETQIQIKVAEKSTFIEISVIDHGIGIPPEDLPHIFERFYRVDKARSRHTGGTGLGLSIVASIIEAHHGAIQVQSELNKGSCFTVQLPKLLK